ncbi:hypothetical protein D3C72_1831140 [compost metagenome]
MIGYQVLFQAHRHAVLIEQRDIGKAHRGLFLMGGGRPVGTVVDTVMGLGEAAAGGEQAEAEQSAAIEHFHRTLLEPESDAC